MLKVSQFGGRVDYELERRAQKDYNDTGPLYEEG